MPRLRPSLSITLPKNFTYHANDAQQPRTPDAETSTPPPQLPRLDRHHHLRRRSRPALSALFTDPCYSEKPLKDVPLPSIEGLKDERSGQAPSYSASLGSSSRFPHHYTAHSPHTPKCQRRPSLEPWLNPHTSGESISRPLSSCSVVSDSSENSLGSLASFSGADGSCTSPESEASTWAVPVPKRVGHSSAFPLSKRKFRGAASRSARLQPMRWTQDMDRHLWTTYLHYLQDPTVTPFKMLPGVAPPLGVCHRVSRQAKKTWARSKTQAVNTDWGSDPVDPGTVRTDVAGAPLLTTSKAETVRPFSPYATYPWPTSNSSTRRRLRYLCKTNPVIAPHYQRLLQSRSPSPFGSSHRPFSRSQSRLSESMDSSQVTPTAPFNTRDVQLSLTTSTADTMQPNGPLARLTRDHSSLDDQTIEFSEPPVPFASDISIPSDVRSSSNESFLSLETPRLGSPFGFHTWGPSQSRQRIRPQRHAVPANGIATIRPNMQPSWRTESFNQTSLHKRRAPFLTDGDIHPGIFSPEVTNTLSHPPTHANHRRVKSRGLSPSQVYKLHPLQSLFDAPAIHGSTEHAPTEDADAHNQTETRQRIAEETHVSTQDRSLDSPFTGIAPRPQRRLTRQPLAAVLGVLDDSRPDRE